MQFILTSVGPCQDYAEICNRNFKQILTKYHTLRHWEYQEKKKCPADTINEFELHDSPWLWEDVS